MMRRSWHTIGGMLALGLGILGVYDEYVTVVELIKGAVQPLTALIGLVMILSGLISFKSRTPHIVGGLILLGISIFGFFDEYYAVLDFFKGSIPVALLISGFVAMIAGVKNLHAALPNSADLQDREK